MGFRFVLKSVTLSDSMTLNGVLALLRFVIVPTPIYYAWLYKFQVWPVDLLSGRDPVVELLQVLAISIRIFPYFIS